MSFGTGTVTECIYKSTAIGATLSGFTSEAQLNTVATMGVQAELPANFWPPNPTANGRGIYIIARGVLSTTGSPTFTITVRGGATPNTTLSLLLGTAAFTAGTTVTGAYWELEGAVTMTSIGGSGTNSTVRGIGRVLTQSSTTTGALLGFPAWGGAASPGTVATVDTSIVNLININAACGTNNASNNITLNELLVFGIN